LPDRQTILVTGANGQVGRNICSVFDGYYNVVGLSSLEMDVGEISAIQKTFDKVRPDVVINTAAYTKVDDAEINSGLANRTNFHAVKHLCDACLKHNSLLLHFSTDYVFDGAETRLCSEESHANPLNAYGRSKLAGDNYIIENARKYFIFRLAWVYDHAGINFPNKILQAAKCKDRLTVVDDQIGTPTSADFIAKTIYQFITAKDFGDKTRLNTLFNLVPSGEASWFDFAFRLLSRAEELGFDLKCRAKDVMPINSSSLPQKAIRPSRVVLDNSKIQRELGMTFAAWDFYIDGYLEQLRLQNDRI
jgi:dTDP-4-dehydrorhamnose reductase